MHPVANLDFEERGQGVLGIHGSPPPTPVNAPLNGSAHDSLNPGHFKLATHSVDCTK